MKNESDFDINEIIKLYKEGKSTYELAEMFDSYPNRINRILAKYKVPIRDRSDAQVNALKTGKSKHPTLGTKRKDETKLKISRKTRETWNSLEDSEKQSRIECARERWRQMPQTQKEEMQKLATKAILNAAKEGSKIEKEVLFQLTKSGYICKTHSHIIPNDKMEVDIYIPAMRVCIEIDGPSHSLPIWSEERLQQVIKSDLEKNGHILGAGFALIRIKSLKCNITLAGIEDLMGELLPVLKKFDGELPKNIHERFVEINFD